MTNSLRNSDYTRSAKPLPGNHVCGHWSSYLTDVTSARLLGKFNCVTITLLDSVLWPFHSLTNQSMFSFLIIRSFSSPEPSDQTKLSWFPHINRTRPAGVVFSREPNLLSLQDFSLLPSTSIWARPVLHFLRTAVSAFTFVQIWNQVEKTCGDRMWH